MKVDMTTEYRDIIYAGVDFIRALANNYGSDVAIEMWERISATIDPDIKGQIFMAMLIGITGHKMQVSAKVPELDVGSRISIIKLIRTHDMRNLGLKEAKDLVDLISTGKTVELHVENFEKKRTLHDALRFFELNIR